MTATKALSVSAQTQTHKVGRIEEHKKRQKHFKREPPTQKHTE